MNRKFLGLARAIGSGVAMAVLSLSAASSDITNQDLVESPACSFVAEFTQDRAFPDGINFIHASGRLFFDCHKGLIWSVTEPIATTQIFLLNGSTYAIDYLSRVSQIDNKFQKKVGKILSAALSGDAERLRADFELEIDDREGMRLQPKQAMMKRALRGISIRRGDEHFDRLIVIEQVDNQVLTINTSRITPVNSGPNGLAECIAMLGEPSEQACAFLTKNPVFDEDQ